jgi:hypothetical protein
MERRPILQKRTTFKMMSTRLIHGIEHLCTRRKFSVATHVDTLAVLVAENTPQIRLLCLVCELRLPHRSTTDHTVAVLASTARENYLSRSASRDTSTTRSPM